MKIKTDFVTNSSSSSFIVAWPWKIKTIGDVEEFIYERYAETVFNDARNFKTFRVDNPKASGLMAKTITEGYLDDGNVIVISFTEFLNMFCEREKISHDELKKNPVWYAQLWQEREMIVNREAQKYGKNFIKDLTNEHYIYIFKYADEDGAFFSEMEHNKIFRKLKYIQVSHH